MRLRLLGISVLCATLAGCGWSYRTLRWNTPDNETLRYSFQTDHQLSTTLEALPSSEDDEQIEELRRLLSDVSFTFRGTLDKFKAQYFEDTSSAIVTRITSVEGGQSGPGEFIEADVQGLVGKSVAMRIHDSGEIFETLGFEHFAGFGRYGELLADVFTMLSLRLPIELPDAGEPAHIRAEVPLAIDPYTRIERTWELTYRRDGEAEPCMLGEACVVLTYEGRIEETGRNKDPIHYTTVEGAGTVSGSMLFALDARDFQTHEFEVDIERTIRTYQGPFDPRKGEEGEVRAILHQTEHATTELRRIP